MKIDPEAFRVRGRRIGLDERPTRIEPFYRSKNQCKALLRDQVEQLSDLQDLLYASNRYAVLIIFQAMDAAGKDGAIKHVMSGVNPQGCQVFSFKHPSATELAHDFLWRTNQALPERGKIGIFNRSHYEEVLIVRVHPEILRAEGVPDARLDDQDIWQDRFRSIRHQEHHLHRNGTRIIKFFLHLSPEEQGRRFLARIDDPRKNWKFDSADLEERKYWKQYLAAYQDCLNSTSSSKAPWYIVPADDKDNARLIVAKVIVETLKGLKLRYPATDAAKRRELQQIRKTLVQEMKRHR